jgi:hypothetical protein
VQFYEDATRLMRQLVQHRGMATTLSVCSDVLPALIGFIHQVRHILFRPASDLVRQGKPTRGLISTCNPDDKLQWAIDFLGMVGGAPFVAWHSLLPTL